MELKQVPIRISPEAHAKATADAQAQGKTLAKHLSDIVDAMLLGPPAPAPETPAEQSAPIGFVQVEQPEQPAPAPEPETKVVAEPAPEPYVFNGI
jgi:hypothetical protein